MQGFNMGRYVPSDLAGILTPNQASNKPAQRRNPDGSQTVRFELPFAIWCTSCTPETLIGQGVRFNAQKRKVGMYFSTVVWAFRFKHTACGGWIEVKTDPKRAEYVVVSGARRRDYGEDKDREDMWGASSAQKDKEQEKDGVMGKLEAQVKDKQLANEQHKRLEELQKRQERDWADPYEVNKRVRREFRVGRRERQADERKGEALKEKFGLGVDLVGGSEEDVQRARLVDFTRGEEEGRSGAGVLGRGVFESQRGEVEQRKTKEKERGKRGRVHDVAGQRASLQSNLKGNTRLKSDPFINGTNGWQPAARRKRIDGNITHNEHDDQDEDWREREQIFKPDAKSDPAVTTTSASLLVAYDSD